MSDAATEKVPLVELGPGAVVGERWKVERVIGRGPHGTVHRVSELNGPRSAALKLLSGATRADAPFAARFERECREIQTLRHPGLAQLYDFGWQGDAPYVISELVAGTAFDEWFSGRRASADELLPLAAQLCDAVSLIHRQALVHRALKPGNVRIDPARQLHLLDLGTARDFASPVLQLPSFAGEVRFLAPEQLQALPVDHRADIYALGALLFLAATGRAPFEASTLADRVRAALSAPPPNAAHLFPDVPAGVAAVLARALAKSPAERFPSAEALKDSLERAVRGGAQPKAPEPAPDASNQVGRYRLIRKIATGGMAEVFLASAQGVMGFEKQVAVKRILPMYSEDPKFVERFLKEAQWVARLDHPNIVQIFDCGKAGDTYYIAMEYVDGPNVRALANSLARRGPVDLPVALRLGAYAAEGLGYAHQWKNPDTGEPGGLIHRDVSPENILVSRNGAVKVVDFGIAKAVDSRTRSTSLRGKYAYLAPEQVLYQASGPGSDVYSLAVVLYELLSGQRPYDATTEQETLQAIAAGAVVPLRRRRPSAPEEVERLLARALSKDPSERPRDGAAFAEELRAYLASISSSVGNAELARWVSEYDVGPGTVAIPAAGAEESPAAATPLGLNGMAPRPDDTRVEAYPERGEPAREAPAVDADAAQRIAQRIRFGEAAESSVGTAEQSPPRRRTGESPATVDAVAAPRAGAKPGRLPFDAVAPLPLAWAGAVQETLMSTGKVGEFWRSPVRRQVAVTSAVGLAGALLLFGVVRPSPAESRAATPPPLHRYVPDDWGVGAGGSSHGSSSGGSFDPQSAPGKVRRKQADLKGQGGEVRFDASRSTEVFLDGIPLGTSPAPVEMKPGTYTALFVTGASQHVRTFNVPPGGRVVVRP